MQVDLTEVELSNLMAIINAAQIKGNDAETVAMLKVKLRGVPAEPEPEGGE